MENLSGQTTTPNYYTPTIEEFHVGFHCELKDAAPPENDWHTHVVSNFDSFPLLEKWLNQGDVRVKFLDENDLNECGWDDSRDMSCLCWNDDIDFQLDNGFTDNFVRIYVEDEIGFYGKIKNKSELKRIMNQLGIEKSHENSNS